VQTKRTTKKKTNKTHTHTQQKKRATWRAKREGNKGKEEEVREERETGEKKIMK
jgi:hypothetical protein